MWSTYLNFPFFTKTTTDISEKRLLSLWNKYSNTTIGRTVFNWFISRSAPYSGSIRAQVISLSSGLSLVSLKDHRAIRNHLNSIHAIALANLGELASGLAMLSALPLNTRAIVTNLEIEYLKKARGHLTAEGTANPPKIISEPIDSIANAMIKDAEGDTVSIVKVKWRLSPKELKVN